ncbi:unnamed protein product [Amoebophrya sp. A25]|nr:unnamed protein product [Amoebophrya sp. A25]|eukprot:GSA25T00012634001.1
MQNFALTFQQVNIETLRRKDAAPDDRIDPRPGSTSTPADFR